MSPDGWGEIILFLWKPDKNWKTIVPFHGFITSHQMLTARSSTVFWCVFYTWGDFEWFNSCKSAGKAHKVCIFSFSNPHGWLTQGWSNASRCTNQPTLIQNVESCECVTQFVCRIKRDEERPKKELRQRVAAECVNSLLPPPSSPAQSQTKLWWRWLSECHPSLYLFRRAGWLRVFGVVLPADRFMTSTGSRLP